MASASHPVRALVLTERDRITYRSRTTNQCYAGHVLSASSEAIQVQLDGVSELKTVGPNEFWRVSTSAVVNSRMQQSIAFFKTGQSVVYTSRSNGQLYPGRVAGPSAAGGVILQLDGVPNSKEVSPSDLWRIRNHDPRDGYHAHATATPDSHPASSGPVPACGQELPKSLEQQTAEILRSGGMRLVSAIWLLKQDENFRVRRLQDLLDEDGALLDCDFAAQLILSGAEAEIESTTDRTRPRVVALSYRWLREDHPDPDGTQLAKLREYLALHIAANLDQHFPVLRGSPERQVGQRDIDVGVLWDFMSLYQRPYEHDGEESQFLSGLSCINRMYGMEDSTLTLQLKAVPEGINPYERSGWCRFEEAVSGIIKRPELLVAFQDGAVPFGNEMNARYWEFKTKKRPLDEMVQNKSRILSSIGLGAVANYLVYTTEDDWSAFISRCSGTRQPPIHPDDMEELLLNPSEVVFTNKNDPNKVPKIYREFFDSLANHCTEFQWAPKVTMVMADRTKSDSVKWSAGQMETFAKSLGCFKMCVSLNVSGLELTPQTASCFLEAASMLPSLQQLTMDQDHIEGLKSCPDTAKFIQALENKGVKLDLVYT